MIGSKVSFREAVLSIRSDTHDEQGKQPSLKNTQNKTINGQLTPSQSSLYFVPVMERPFPLWNLRSGFIDD